MSNYETLAKIMGLAEEYYSKEQMKHAIEVAGFASADASTRTNVDASDAFVIGLAHDLIYKTECPQKELNDILGEELFTTLLLLTKDDNVAYKEYVSEIIKSEDPLAILVKRADLKSKVLSSSYKGGIIAYIAEFL